METQIVQQKIIEIRGKKVMLDFDLAALYEVETKVFNQAVKRNSARFPEDFMFQLTKEEWETNWSQFVTSSLKHRGKSYLPYAFTEHGVTMLASVLKSEKAVKMSIAIVRAFISLKEFVQQDNKISLQLQLLKEELGERINEHDVQLLAIYDAIENLISQQTENQEWHKRKKIGFNKE